MEVLRRGRKRIRAEAERSVAALLGSGPDGLAAGPFFSTLLLLFFQGSTAEKVSGEDPHQEDYGDVEEMGGGHGLLPEFALFGELPAGDGLAEEILECFEVFAGNGADTEEG